MGMAIFYRCGAVASGASAREASLIAPSASGGIGAVAMSGVCRNEFHVTPL